MRCQSDNGIVYNKLNLYSSARWIRLLATLYNDQNSIPRIVPQYYGLVIGQPYEFDLGMQGVSLKPFENILENFVSVYQIERKL